MQNVLLTGLAKEFQKIIWIDKGEYRWLAKESKENKKARKKSIWPRVWWASESP